MGDRHPDLGPEIPISMNLQESPPHQVNPQVVLQTKIYRMVYSRPLRGVEMVSMERLSSDAMGVSGWVEVFSVRSDDILADGYDGYKSLALLSFARELMGE